MPIDADALEEWSRQHAGFDVSRSMLVRGWLSMVTALARPLARRGVPPDAVTAAGVLTAAGAGATASPVVAAALVLVTSVLDGVDGAVARLRRRDSRRGVVVDHLADRVSDVLFVVALRRAGCRPGVATTALASSMGYEAMRDVLRVAGRDTGMVTVGDRPMRVATVVMGLLVAPTAAGWVIVAQSVAGAARLTATCQTPAALSGQERLTRR